MKRIQHALVLTGLALALAACRSDGPDPEEQLAMHREFALSYYDEGDLPRAADQVEKGLEIAPRDEQLKLMKGWVNQRMGTAENIFIAEQVFRELVPKKDYRALLGLGQSLERKGVLYWESADAVASGERYSSAGDPGPRVRELRSKARAAWKESISFYEATLDKKPGELQAMNGLQRVNALNGDVEASLGWSRLLLEQSGAEVTFWEGQLERPELSATEEQRLRDVLESSRVLQAQTHLQASILLVTDGQPEQALEHVELALLIDPEAAAFHSRRAQILHILGRSGEAIASLETYLRISEEDFDHPDVARALELLSTWKAETALELGSNSPGLED